MASSLRVNAIVPASGTNVAIGTAGGTITYAASVSGVSTFSSGIVVSAGTTAAPSISPTGDSNTGIFFPSADTIAFGEGGSESARFDSNGRLGIGTQIPSAVINVRSSAAELARFTNTGSNGGDWEIKLGGGGFEDRKFMLTDKFGGTDNVRVFVDSSGRVTMPYQPVFYAYRTTNWTTIPGVVICDNTIANVGNYYSTSTGRFTAPIAGTYQFTLFTMAYTSLNTYNDNYLRKNGNAVAGAWLRTWSGPSNGAITSMSCYLSLAVGDYIDFYVNNGPALYSDGNVWIRFGGHLVG
jgi:hypothetical protein